MYFSLSAIGFIRSPASASLSDLLRVRLEDVTFDDLVDHFFAQSRPFILADGAMPPVPEEVVRWHDDFVARGECEPDPKGELPACDKRIAAQIPKEMRSRLVEALQPQLPFRERGISWQIQIASTWGGGPVGVLDVQNGGIHMHSDHVRGFNYALHVKGPKRWQLSGGPLLENGNATVYVVEVQAGEVLFWPPYWPHGTETMEGGGWSLNAGLMPCTAESWPLIYRDLPTYCTAQFFERVTSRVRQVGGCILDESSGETRMTEPATKPSEL